MEGFFIIVSMNNWFVDIATKKVPRKIVFSFVESATDMFGNRNKKPWKIWSYVVVIRRITKENPKSIWINKYIIHNEYVMITIKCVVMYKYILNDHIHEYMFILYMCTLNIIIIIIICTLCCKI
jgi:hypothetical protein